MFQDVSQFLDELLLPPSSTAPSASASASGLPLNAANAPAGATDPPLHLMPPSAQPAAAPPPWPCHLHGPPLESALQPEAMCMDDIDLPGIQAMLGNEAMRMVLPEGDCGMDEFGPDQMDVWLLEALLAPPAASAGSSSSLPCGFPAGVHHPQQQQQQQQQWCLQQQQQQHAPVALDASPAASAPLELGAPRQQLPDGGFGDATAPVVSPPSPFQELGHQLCAADACASAAHLMLPGLTLGSTTPPLPCDANGMMPGGGVTANPCAPLCAGAPHVLPGTVSAPLMGGGEHHSWGHLSQLRQLGHLGSDAPMTWGMTQAGALQQPLSPVSSIASAATPSPPTDGVAAGGQAAPGGDGSSNPPSLMPTPLAWSAQQQQQQQLQMSALGGASLAADAQVNNSGGGGGALRGAQPHNAYLGALTPMMAAQAERLCRLQRQHAALLAMGNHSEALRLGEELALATRRCRQLAGASMAAAAAGIGGGGGAAAASLLSADDMLQRPRVFRPRRSSLRSVMVPGARTSQRRHSLEIYPSMAAAAPLRAAAPPTPSSSAGFATASAASTGTCAQRRGGGQGNGGGQSKRRRASDSSVLLCPSNTQNMMRMAAIRDSD